MKTKKQMLNELKKKVASLGIETLMELSGDLRNYQSDPTEKNLKHIHKKYVTTNA